jgi:hypothetical protein
MYDIDNKCVYIRPIMGVTLCSVLWVVSCCYDV